MDVNFHCHLCSYTITLVQVYGEDRKKKGRGGREGEREREGERKGEGERAKGREVRGTDLVSLMWLGEAGLRYNLSCIHCAIVSINQFITVGKTSLCAMRKKKQSTFYNVI